MPVSKQVLFLTLNTFSLTGGIEKVCRSVCYILQNHPQVALQVLSLHDHQADSNYILPEKFKGFAGKKPSFLKQVLLIGGRADILILSHVNLLLLAKLAKKINPKLNVILLAHGIEIWQPLKTWKVNFLRKHIKIWAVSTFTANRISEVQGIDLQQIEVLPNGLDPFFHPPQAFIPSSHLQKKYGLTPAQVVLFSLGRLSFQEQYKGYDLVIKALTFLPDHFVYLLAGKADEAEEQRIRALIQENQLNHRVILCGYLETSAVSDHFLLANLFVMPSKAEGFGLSFIEAAAHGCRVIAGNQDGSAEALLKGKLGLLVNPEDVQNLAEKISLLANQQHQTSEKKQQQSLCLSQFSFEVYAQRFNQLLKPYLIAVKNPLAI